MNLSNKKIWRLGGGMCGLVLLVETIVLVFATLEFSQRKKTLEQSYHRLSQLHDRNPFPSSSNVKMMQANVDNLEYHVGELAAGVRRDPFPRDAIEATDFSARAQDVIERFKKRAAVSGVKLPETLEVGFAEYASEGAVPDSENVPRLSRELYSVERVAEVLVRCGVDSIDNLTRDVFESSMSSDQQAPRRRPTRNAPSAPKGRRSDLDASIVHSDPLYYIERVGVSFSAHEAVVWNVLNQFAATPHFMVVSQFAHSTKASILNYNPETVKRGGDEADETLRYLANGILAGEGALSRPERIIAGNELIQVRLVLEVYNFDPEGSAK